MIFPDPKSVFRHKKPPPSPNYGHSYQGSSNIPSPPALPSPPLARQSTAASRSNGKAMNPRKATPSPSNQFATADPSAYVHPFPGMATAVAASPVVATARAGMKSPSVKSPPVRVVHCPLQARMADTPPPPRSMRRSARTVQRPTTDARKLSTAKFLTGSRKRSAGIRENVGTTSTSPYPPVKRRRVIPSSASSASTATSRRTTSSFTTTSTVSRPERQGEYVRVNHLNPNPYGSPCLGCQNRFCKNMRFLATAKATALKCYRPEVHSHPSLLPQNAFRRNDFYGIIKKIIGLSSIKLVPFCAVQHAKQWFPMKHDLSDGNPPPRARGNDGGGPRPPPGGPPPAPDDSDDSSDDGDDWRIEMFEKEEQLKLQKAAEENDTKTSVQMSEPL